MSQRHKQRQSRARASVGANFGSSAPAPTALPQHVRGDSAFIPWPAGGTTAQTSISGPFAGFPGTYPFWSQPPQPGSTVPTALPTPTSQPGTPGGGSAYVPPQRRPHQTQGEGHAPKRQRFQEGNRPSDGVQKKPSAPPRLQPQGPPASTPPALLPSASRPGWVEPAQRVILGHFPHSSLSLPLAAVPRTPTRDGGFQNSRRTNPPHLSQSHSRNPSVNRVGPPPKAILGGPGGKPFEELRAQPKDKDGSSPSVSLKPSPTPSAVVSRAPSPLRAQSEDREPCEVKLGSNIVRIALPPERYSPPDTPAEAITQSREGDRDSTNEKEGNDEANDIKDDTDKPPFAPRLPRKEAFPWPNMQVATTPHSIPLPLSPTEDDLSSVERALDAETSDNSNEETERPEWNGRGVVVAVPDQEAWEKLRPTPSTQPSPPGSDVWETAAGSSSTFSPPAYTAFEWPPTRSITPEEPAFSPIEEEFADDEQDSDVTETPSVTSPRLEDEEVPMDEPSFSPRIVELTEPGADTVADAAPQGDTSAKVDTQLDRAPDKVDNQDGISASATPSAAASPAPSKRNFSVASITNNVFLKRSLGGLLGGRSRRGSVASRGIETEPSSPLTAVPGEFHAEINSTAEANEPSPEKPATAALSSVSSAETEDTANTSDPVAHNPSVLSTAAVASHPGDGELTSTAETESADKSLAEVSFLLAEDSLPDVSFVTAEPSDQNGFSQSKVSEVEPETHQSSTKPATLGVNEPLKRVMFDVPPTPIPAAPLPATPVENEDTPAKVDAESAGVNGNDLSAQTATEGTEQPSMVAETNIAALHDAGPAETILAAAAAVELPLSSEEDNLAEAPEVTPADKATVDIDNDSTATTNAGVASNADIAVDTKDADKTIDSDKINSADKPVGTDDAAKAKQLDEPAQGDEPSKPAADAEEDGVLVEIRPAISNWGELHTPLPTAVDEMPLSAREPLRVRPRITGGFALNRQLQGFLRNDGVAFRPSAKRRREEAAAAAAKEGEAAREAEAVQAAGDTPTADDTATAVDEPKSENTSDEGRTVPTAAAEEGEKVPIATSDDVATEDTHTAAGKVVADEPTSQSKPITAVPTSPTLSPTAATHKLASTSPYHSPPRPPAQTAGVTSAHHSAFNSPDSQAAVIHQLTAFDMPREQDDDIEVLADPTTPQTQFVEVPSRSPTRELNSAFTFGPPSVQTSPAKEHCRMSSSTSHSSPLRPSAVPFMPPELPPQQAKMAPAASFKRPIPSFTPQRPVNANAPKGAADGGALQFFTFAHKLRPNANEFRPGCKPPALDLSLAQPSSLAFASLGTPFRFNPEAAVLKQPFTPLLTPGIQTGVDRPPLPIRPRQPLVIKRPHSPESKPPTPLRLEASPRIAPSKKEIVDVPHAEKQEVTESRDTPRHRTHTAKRSSQNSHLPRAWPRSQPTTPAVENSDNVLIHPSLPLRMPSAGSKGSHLAGTPEEVPLSRQVSSNATFSPIAPLPSEVGGGNEGMAPHPAGERSVSAPVGRLNPVAKPFVFGAAPSTPPVFTLSTSLPVRPFDHSTPIQQQGGTPPDIQVDPTDDQDNRKFRQWTFPTSVAGSPTGSASHKRSHSDSDEEPTYLEDEGFSNTLGAFGWPAPFPAAIGSTQTSVEFPLRATIVDDLVVPGRRSPDSSVAAIALPRDTLVEMLTVMKAIGEQVAQIKVDHETIATESARRAEEAENYTTVANDTLEMIREYVSSSGAIENVTAILETHTELLQEIQRKIEEETRSSTAASQVEESTLVEAPVPQEMFTAILSGQHAMMTKLSLLAESAEYDLRSATDALLEAQAEARQVKIDQRTGHELVHLRDLLKEESEKTRAAEREVATLTGKLAEVEKRAKDKELEDVWRALIRADVAAATSALAKVTRSEETAREELQEMRDLLAKQAAAQQAAMEVVKEERDTALRIAKEQHDELLEHYASAAAFRQTMLERMEAVATAFASERQEVTTMRGRESGAIDERREGVLRERIAQLEKETSELRAELSTVQSDRADLRVHLAQAQGAIALEQEKALRVADAEANAKRTIELQLKAEKSRSTFLENRASKAESEMQEVAKNLDLWRSAAMEQRLRAEQSAAHIAAMQQENYHWREFALGADRHRLEQWLETRPFEGLDHILGPEETVHGTPAKYVSPINTGVHSRASSPSKSSPSKSPSKSAHSSPTKSVASLYSPSKTSLLFSPDRMQSSTPKKFVVPIINEPTVTE